MLISIVRKYEVTMFIRLTREYEGGSQEPIYINLHHVSTYSPNVTGHHTVIWLYGDTRSILVKEPIEEVTKMINATLRK